MVQSILSNLAIILLGHLCMSKLVNKRQKLSDKVLFAGIVGLFSTVVISMFYLPIIIDGYRFDLRLIPLIFLAMFRGCKVTLATLAIVCTWRYFMGGVGTIPGIVAGMVCPTLFVLAFCALKKEMNKIYQQILLLTTCWFISDFPIVFIIPNGWEVFKGFFIIRYSSFLAVGFIYYYFIKAEHSKVYYKQELERLAWHDQLTQLLNRNKFIELVQTKSQTSEQNAFIALIDIDHFKQINDTYGHIIGDRVLMELAATFNEHKESNMMFARYGGEEFIVYLEERTLEDAIRVLERVRQKVRETAFHIDCSNHLHISISIGVAPLQKEVPLKDTIHLADQHLYIAKEQGRDQLIANCELVFH